MNTKSLEELKTAYQTTFKHLVTSMLIIDEARHRESEPSEALTTFIDNFDIDWETKLILVLHSSTNEYIGGTSAELLSYEKMSVKNLLYAMMLPSGNDAA